MKRKTELELTDVRRYDWSKATRGRFAALAAPKHKPCAVRIIDADLEEAFPDSESMNRALRALVDAARGANLKKAKVAGKSRKAA
jgi:hypothetical protein